MTRGIYLSTATDEIYSSEAIDYIAQFDDVFRDLAALTGISPAAIASAMAEEMSAYDWKDMGVDIYAKSAANPASSAAGLLAALAGGPVGVTAWLATNAVSTRSHEEWLADYQAVHDFTEAPSEIQKILHPTLIDAGPSNFKIKTAIDLVREYADDYTSLDLGDYLNDYTLLVKDLMDESNPLSAKLWGLYMKEAEDWFSDPEKANAYNGQWNNLPQSYKDALLITFANRGQESMETTLPPASSGAVYMPQPGLTSSGGMNHLLNAATIASTIGLTGYGNEMVAVGNLGIHANVNNEEGLAARFALYGMRYTAVTGLDYSPYNVNGELDLYDPVTRQGQMTTGYIQARAEFINLWVEEEMTDHSPSGYEYVQYTDLLTGKTVEVQADGSNSPAKQVIFGSTAAETFWGLENGDRLFGMAGDDVLNGMGGDDYLEGGQGSDRFRYSSADEGDGHDTIGDADTGGDGIIIDGIDLSNVEFKQVDEGSTLYQTDNHSLSLKVNSEENTAVISILTGDVPGTIRLNYFQDGDFGIQLTAFEEPESSNAPEGVFDASLFDVDLGVNGQDLFGRYGVRSLKHPEINSAPIYYQVREYYAEDFATRSDAALWGWGFHGGDQGDFLYGDENSDYLLGINGDDLLDGKGEQDYLEGGAGSDTLYGGDGQDVLFGQAANLIHYAYNGDTDVWIEYPVAVENEDDQDKLYGGKDADEIIGGSYGDLLSGEHGNDHLVAGFGNDVVLGGEGNDLVFGDTQGVLYEEFSDFPFYKDGSGGWNVAWIHQYVASEQSGFDYNDIIDAGSGDDIVFAELGDDLVSGGEGNDILMGDRLNKESYYVNLHLFGDLSPYVALNPAQHGNDQLYGDAGDDELYGNGGDDALYGGEGNDVIIGDDSSIDNQFHGNDTAYGGNGDDVIHGLAGDDVLYGENGNDYVDGHEGDDIAYGGDGKDLVIGREGNDSLFGGSGDDELQGLDGNDFLEGDQGNDKIFGQDGNDVLSGGAGADILNGGDGDDVYVLNIGDGEAVIEDSSGTNTLRFAAAINASDLRFFDATGSSGTRYILIRYSNSDSVSVPFAELGRLDRLEFGDGSVASLGALISESSPEEVLIGDGVDDNVTGGANDDILIGGIGNDQLSGGAGNDNYRFGLGDGSDTLTDNFGETRILLGPGISGDDIQVALTPNGMVISYSSTDSITVNGLAFDNSIILSDGTTYYVQSLFENSSPGARQSTTSNKTYGTAGADIINGSDAQESVYAGAGNDVVSGRDGSDALYGEAGNDVLFGGGGNDFLNGGPGNDLLYGGSGSNYFDGGEGNDQVWFASEEADYSMHTYSAYDRGGDDTYILESQGTYSIADIWGNDRIFFGKDVRFEDLYFSKDIWGKLFIHWGDSSLVISEIWRYGSGIYDYSNYSSTRIIEELIFSDGTSVFLSDVIEQMIDHPDPVYEGGDQEFVVSLGEVFNLSVVDLVSESGLLGDFNYSQETSALYAENTDSNLPENYEYHDTIHRIDYFNTPYSRIYSQDYLPSGYLDLRFDAGYYQINVTGIDKLGGHFEVPVYLDVQGQNPRNDIRIPHDPIVVTVGESLHFDYPYDKDIVYAGQIYYHRSILSINGYKARDVYRDTDIDGIEAFKEVSNTDSTETDQIDIPSWLHYDPATKRFYGSPAVTDFDDEVIFEFYLDGYESAFEFEQTMIVYVNVAPVAVTDELSAEIDSALYLDSSELFDNDTDLNEDTLSITEAGNAVNGQVEFDSETGGITFTPVTGFIGIATFEYTVSDGYASALGVVNIRVGLADEQPDNVVEGNGTGNVLTGTSLADHIIAYAGQDTVYGGDGNDTIVGGKGKDTLKGEGGDDTFLVEGSNQGADRIYGGAGVDAILGGNGNDVITLVRLTPADSLERIDGRSGSNEVRGTGGDNVLNFSITELLNIAVIDGGGGHDKITGSVAADTIIGGKGNDRLKGEDGNDTFLVDGTNQGADHISGGAGFDIILGGSGNDDITLTRLALADSVERIDGGLGLNRLLGTGADNILNFSTTELLNISVIDGGAGNDKITGSAAADTIVGGKGNDTLKGEDGNDTFVVEGSNQGADHIRGGAGFDVILGGNGDDDIRLTRFNLTDNVEQIDGGAGVNRLLGTGADNVLNFSATELITIALIDGGAGHDKITGSAGDDTISGGKGKDTLMGGAGDDLYWFSLGDGNDIVKNFGTSPEEVDTLFFENISNDMLWFSTIGDHLLVSVVGTNDSVKVNNWYNDEGSNQLDYFEAAGLQLHRSDVEQLVSAMAVYAKPEGSGAVISDEIMLQLSPLLADLWG